jgi:hypothetical protein
VAHGVDWSHRHPDHDVHHKSSLRFSVAGPVSVTGCGFAPVFTCQSLQLGLYFTSPYFPPSKLKLRILDNCFAINYFIGPKIPVAVGFAKSARQVLEAADALACWQS